MDARFERNARARRALLEDHRQHAVDERLVRDVVLEALLDQLRAPEQVLELVCSEIPELEEMLHAAAAAAGASERKALMIGARIETTCRASLSWMMSGGSSRITLSTVTFATRPAASARRTMSPQGRSSSTPIMRPWPRTSFTPATPESSRLNPSMMMPPMAIALAMRPSFSMISRVVSAATETSGPPPNVVPWLPGLNTFAAAPRARQAPMGTPEPSP